MRDYMKVKVSKVEALLLIALEVLPPVLYNVTCGF